MYVGVGLGRPLLLYFPSLVAGYFPSPLKSLQPKISPTKPLVHPSPRKYFIQTSLQLDFKQSLVVNSQGQYLTQILSIISILIQQIIGDYWPLWLIELIIVLFLPAVWFLVITKDRIWRGNKFENPLFYQAQPTMGVDLSNGEGPIIIWTIPNKGFLCSTSGRMKAEGRPNPGKQQFFRQNVRKGVCP